MAMKLYNIFPSDFLQYATEVAKKYDEPLLSEFIRVGLNLWTRYFLYSALLQYAIEMVKKLKN